MSKNYLSDDDDDYTQSNNVKKDSYGIDYNYAGYDMNYNNYDEGDEYEELTDEVLERSKQEEEEYNKQLYLLALEKSKNKPVSNFFVSDKKETSDKEKTSIKEEKKNKKNILNINEFNKLIEKEIEDAKPKKFVSKRLLEKKGITNDTELNNIDASHNTITQVQTYINKRKFNPRKPPYFHVFPPTK